VYLCSTEDEKGLYETKKIVYGSKTTREVGKMENAKIIETAKIVEISGDSKSGYFVRLDNGKTYDLSKKALWSWGRLQEGHKPFDQRVRDNYAALLDEEGLDPDNVPKPEQIRLKRMASAQAFADVYEALQKQKSFQAITKQSRNGEPELFSVATSKHILLDPARVMEIGKKVFSSLGIQEYDRHSGVIQADQLAGLYDKSNGLNLGLSFSSGNIYTQNAITISQMIELEVCTNPLIWLRGMLKTFMAGKRLEWRARMLRLEAIQDEKVLEKRIIATVEDVRSGEKGLLGIIESSKRKLLTKDVAETILKAFSSSYGIGESIQGEVMSEYKESNGASLYDLAQATSHIAWSSQGFREDATRARSSLTGIAAVLTTIEDPQKTYQVCKQRLEAKAVK